MSFEYNGVVYRDLEPQVRYDAEQVQLLKQADATINENLQTVNESLQTVNTEIDGKLTKPANPSAESAVTMLADGTVGTKPLSEIGGGGKLYLHKLKLNFTTSDNITGYIYIFIYKTDNIEINTLNKIKSISDNFVGGYVTSTRSKLGVVYVDLSVLSDTNIDVFGVVGSSSGTVIIAGRYTINNIIDTRIEL